MVQPLAFPLFERAVERGVLEEQTARIVYQWAPTATGKSFIECEVIRSALDKKKPGPHAYLVPFRSLANEIYDGFQDLLGSTNFRLRISTADQRNHYAPKFYLEYFADPASGGVVRILRQGRRRATGTKAC